MKISKNCLTLVKKWEGFYANAYLCPANVWTIGFGTTVWPSGAKVKKGDTITRDEAEKLLEKQVQQHADTIMQYVKVPLNQNQFDALASFQYNLGRHILKGSYLLGYLNNKQWDKATNSMMQYNKARVNGVLQPLKGLTNRRTEEVSLFKKAVSVSAIQKEETIMTQVNEQYQKDAAPTTWSKDAVEWAKKNGVSDGTYLKRPATREEVITMIYNAQKK